MTDVLLVYAQSNQTQAEALAEAFDSAGFSVSDANVDDDQLQCCGAAVIVWSDTAVQSRAFMAAAERVLDAGKGLVACLPDLPASRFGALQVFDLSRWSGHPDDPRLDRLVATVNRRVIQARAPAPLADIEAFAAHVAAQ